MAPVQSASDATAAAAVSIAYVVRDLHTTVSGVQAAIALEALVSAAFILIGGKVGDLIGRRRAYALGLVAYAIGAVAMTLSQSLTAIIVFWAIVGGTGPLLGGFITTFLSWRVAFGLEAAIIAVVLSGLGLVRDVPFTGERGIDTVGAALSVVGMGGIVTGILVWQEGGESVAALIVLGVVAMVALVWWLRRRKREGRPALLDPDLFRSPAVRLGVTQQMLQQIALGGAMIALPIYLRMVLEYNALQAGLSLAPLSLSMFGVAGLAGKKAKGRLLRTLLRRGDHARHPLGRLHPETRGERRAGARPAEPDQRRPRRRRRSDE